MYPELNANGRSRSTSCQSSAEMRISVNYEAIRQTAWKRRVSYLVSPLLDEGSVVYWWLISCVHCLFHLAWGQSALKCAAYCLISCSRWQYNSTGVKLMFYYPGQPEHKKPVRSSASVFAFCPSSSIMVKASLSVLIVYYDYRGLIYPCCSAEAVSAASDQDKNSEVQCLRWIYQRPLECGSGH